MAITFTGTWEDLFNSVGGLCILTALVCISLIMLNILSSDCLLCARHLWWNSYSKFFSFLKFCFLYWSLRILYSGWKQYQHVIWKHFVLICSKNSQSFAYFFIVCMSVCICSIHVNMYVWLCCPNWPHTHFVAWKKKASNFLYFDVRQSFLGNIDYHILLFLHLVISSK